MGYMRGIVHRENNGPQIAQITQITFIMQNQLSVTSGPLIPPFNQSGHPPQARTIPNYPPRNPR
jgi:hypothetical protein